MQFFFDFSGAPDIVQDVNHRFRGGFHDVRRQANAVEAAAVVVCHDVHLAQRILALACGLMSWKFRTLQEAISWAFVSKLAAKTEMDMGVFK